MGMRIQVVWLQQQCYLDCECMLGFEALHCVCYSLYPFSGNLQHIALKDRTGTSLRVG